MKQVKRAKSTDSSKHYVTNAVLLPAVIRAKQEGKVTDELISMITMIAERYSMKWNFARYSFREDMVSEAVTNLCASALRFDLERGTNPFSYYTTAIHNSFIHYIGEERIQRQVRDTLISEAGSNPSFNFLEREKDESSGIILDSDSIDYSSSADSHGDAGGAESESIGDSTQFERSARAVELEELRAPGPVKIISKEDIIYDPVTGKISYKHGPDEVITVDPHAGKKMKKIKKKPDRNWRPFQKKKPAAEGEPEAPVETLLQDSVEQA